jgi:hypothetical protein
VEESHSSAHQQSSTLGAWRGVAGKKRKKRLEGDEERLIATKLERDGIMIMVWDCRRTRSGTVR